MLSPSLPSRNTLNLYFRWMALSALALWLVTVITLSLLPYRSIASLTPPLTDNVIHAIAYGIGALIASLCFPRPVLIWISITFIGALVEFGQGWIGTGRSSEFGEAIANGLGALLGVALALALKAGFQWLRERH